MDKYQNQFPLVFGVDASAHVIFAIIFGGLGTIFLIGSIIISLELIIPAIVFFLFWILFMIAFESCKIILDEKKITFKTLFSKETMLFSDITDIKVQIKAENMRREGGMYRWVITGKDREKPLIIGIKPFSGQDLSVITNILLVKAKNAKFDESTRNLQKGNLAPIVNTGVKSMIQQIIAAVVLLMIVLVIYYIF